MPQKTLFLLIALIGLVLLLVLVFAGEDLRRASQSGPRWRRRLVCAALFLLGCLGCSSPGTPTKVTSPVVAGQSLEETPQWQYVSSVWREAEEVASGKRGDYPFDEKGKEELMASLQETVRTVNRLATAGTLSDSEAKLLAIRLNALSHGVQAKRPTELRNASCYEPMPLKLPAGESLKRLQVRLPLLQKLAEEKAIHPVALEKILPPIEADLKTLTSAEEVKRLGPDRQAEVEKARKEGETAVSAIRALLKAKK